MTETMATDVNTNMTEQQPETQDQKPEGNPVKGQSQSGSQQASKPSKSRHRASVACASCRDRRIRVCSAQSSQVSLLICRSALCLQVTRSAHNANDQAWNA
jgi:hypothetical protein